MEEIKNTSMDDLSRIYELFDSSIIYQERGGFPVWKNYDKNAIINDIKESHQFKVIIDSQIAMVFSIRFTDPVIWRTMDTGNSIYLHRIVVNPEFKGMRLFGKVLDWAIDLAKVKKLSTIRMDTWAANHTIVNYYKTFGFNFIENYTTPDSELLPVHNRNLALTLLEFPIV